jgi:hypothetical protein
MPERRTKEDFISNSVKIHGNRYNYNNVNYVNNKTKVKIICDKHGMFFQTPNDHIGGHGCRKCSEENQLNYNLKEAYSEKNDNFPLDVYVIELEREDGKFLKVGISKDYKQRLKNIATKAKGKVNLLLLLPCTLKEATLLEDKVFKELRKSHNPNFKDKFSGYSECLLYTAHEPIIEVIKDFLINNCNRSPLVGKILDLEYN